MHPAPDHVTQRQTSSIVVESMVLIYYWRHDINCCGPRLMCRWQITRRQNHIKPDWLHSEQADFSRNSRDTNSPTSGPVFLVVLYFLCFYLSNTVHRIRQTVIVITVCVHLAYHQMTCSTTVSFNQIRAKFGTLIPCKLWRRFSHL